MKKNQIILAGTNLLFSDALRLVLENDGNYTVTVECASETEAVKNLSAAKPDVMVLYHPQPALGLIEALREAGRRAKDIHVLFIVKEATGDLLAFAGESSSVGIMDESSCMKDFMQAVRAIARGERYISRAVLASAGICSERKREDDPLTEVTPREREVLYWLSHGLSNKEISERMILSEKTIKNHVSHILKKLELADRTKAAALAWREGLPQISEEFFSLRAQAMLK